MARQDYYRKLVPTTCIECVVNMMGWESTDPDWPAIGYITLLSNHHYVWLGTFKTRIKGAWKILRHREVWPDFELNTREECQGVIDGLTEMRDKLWPVNVVPSKKVS